MILNADLILVLEQELVSQEEQENVSLAESPSASPSLIGKVPLFFPLPQ